MFGGFIQSFLFSSFKNSQTTLHIFVLSGSRNFYRVTFLIFVFSYFIVCFCCLMINSENQKYGSFVSANLREMYFWGITSKCVFSLQLLKWWCWSSDWIEILPKNRKLVFIQTLAFILNVYISHSRIIVDFHFQLILSEYRQCFYLFLLFLRACRRWKN